MKLNDVISKIAEMATRLDQQGHAAAVELDDLLMRSTAFIEAGPPPEAAPTFSASVQTASGPVVVSSHLEAMRAIADGIAQKSDFIAAASDRAYANKDIAKLAEIKAASDPFKLSTAYLISAQ